MTNSAPKTRLAFNPGALVMTQGVAELARKGMPVSSLVARHVTGDWGTVPTDDAAANARALVDGSRIVSSYQIHPWPKVWIITEADRSSTTLLLPEEY